VGTESIQSPLHVSLFVSLQPFLINVHSEEVDSMWVKYERHSKGSEYLWPCDFSFFIYFYLHKFLNFWFFLSRWGAEWTLMRNKMNFFDFCKWLRGNKEWTMYSGLNNFCTHCLYFVCVCVCVTFIFVACVPVKMAQSARGDESLSNIQRMLRSMTSDRTVMLCMCISELYGSM